jgi:hypothetical protein
MVSGQVQTSLDSVDPFPVGVPITFVQLIQGGALSLCSTRRIHLYPVGVSPRTKVPHATCEGTGLQGRMGPISVTAILQPRLFPVTHPTLEFGNVPFVLFSRF